MMYHLVLTIFLAGGTPVEMNESYHETKAACYQAKVEQREKVDYWISTYCPYVSAEWFPSKDAVAFCNKINELSYFTITCTEE